LLRALPMAPVASGDASLALIERRSRMGRGIGWVAVQPLAAALLAGTRFWNLDRRLAVVASELGVVASELGVVAEHGA
jgi:hypothetical protein